MIKISIAVLWINVAAYLLSAATGGIAIAHFVFAASLFDSAKIVMSGALALITFLLIIVRFHRTTEGEADV